MMSERFWADRLEEVMAYVREHNMILRTTQSDTPPYFICSLMSRRGDTLYETGGAGRTQAEAIYGAYLKWRDYWRPKEAPSLIKDGWTYA
jgi:hypothetical protein